jgi:hypothetical protein
MFSALKPKNHDGLHLRPAPARFAKSHSVPERSLNALLPDQSRNQTRPVPARFGNLHVDEIEWYAANITNPLERLQYLRQATQTKVPARSHSRSLYRFAPVVMLLSVMQWGSVLPPRMHRETAQSPRSAPRVSSVATGAAVLDPSLPDPSQVWLAEQTPEFEVYSNGLRIERRFEVANQPRWFSLLGRNGSPSAGPFRSQPVGIVFHVTESDQVPFEAEQNHNLKRLGRELLLYVRGKRAYHYVIDRFGRVFRIVAESDAAFHAGHSIWADSQWIYLDLNASFLGVAFESKTQADEESINQAQLYSAKLLVDMLRQKYRIPPEDCVTHAQVSVNPDNMRIGWHTDWGADFPFAELGLPNNYQYPNAALAEYGFEYDDAYLKVTGPDLRQGLARAEEQIRQAAAAQNLSFNQYRTSLRKKYKDDITALRHRSAIEETEHESQRN